MKQSWSEAIRFKQMKVLCEVLETTNTRTLEFLRTRYSDNATGFDNVVGFFEALQMLSRDETSVTLSMGFRQFLVTLGNVNDKDPLIKEFVILKLINSKTQFSAEARLFLDEFRFESDTWKFSPSNAQRLKFSGIRNLLMDLDVVDVDQTREGYRLIDTRFLSSNDDGEKRVVRRVDWTKLNEEREQVGRQAELAVIQFERNRLLTTPIPLSAIEHVAEKNAAAGFDILSFEDSLDNSGGFIPRYIEVKAVSALDYCFHWSKNEIEVAKKHTDRYMLYLLPVKSPGQFYMELLKTIRDPHKYLFNHNDWVWWEDSITFSLRGDVSLRNHDKKNI